MKGKRLIVFYLAFCMSLFQCANRNDTEIRCRTVPAPPGKGMNSHSISTRKPLVPNPLVKLPIGSIKPKGWLRKQLELERDGFTGRLSELSRFLGPDNAWLGGKGSGWEEMPYWLKGFGDLGYVLGDSSIICQTGMWLDAALSSQDPDGYFGPAYNRKVRDLWPNMVMLAALRSLHEATGDQRVLPFMTRYFEFQNGLHADSLLPGSWQKYRGGENLESIYWLYNRTGDGFLLDLAEHVYKSTHDWASPVLTPERDRNWEPSGFYHGVNITMGFRYPAVYYQQSGDARDIQAAENNYRMIMDAYGMQPGGMFAADENIRPGYSDPRQGAETCSMVEFMHSHEELLKITGDIRWADRCEEIAFNSLPASMTPDLKALHYLTAPNLISCDSSGLHDFENRGTLVSFDPRSYRCCQHNAGFGWPYFTEHLWMATLDNGLAALFYSACTVEARVAGGSDLRLAVATDYPFSDTIDMELTLEQPLRFPLYLRVPEWSGSTVCLVNGRETGIKGTPGQYLVLDRKWVNGDRIRLMLPMRIRMKKWEKRKNAVSVQRGPLWYSLKIDEKWNRYSGSEEWPAWEILPASAWNYGILDPEQPEFSISLAGLRPVSGQPFTQDHAPIELSAKAKKIPQWTWDGRMIGELPSGPAHSAEPVEEITLIPMGCARLRLSCFPLLKTDRSKGREN